MPTEMTVRLAMAFGFIRDSRIRFQAVSDAVQAQSRLVEIKIERCRPRPTVQ